eukprot:gene17781-6435_t
MQRRIASAAPHADAGEWVMRAYAGARDGNEEDTADVLFATASPAPRARRAWRAPPLS